MNKPTISIWLCYLLFTQKDSEKGTLFCCLITLSEVGSQTKILSMWRRYYKFEHLLQIQAFIEIHKRNTFFALPAVNLILEQKICGKDGSVRGISLGRSSFGWPSLGSSSLGSSNLGSSNLGSLRLGRPMLERLRLGRLSFEISLIIYSGRRIKNNFTENLKLSAYVLIQMRKVRVIPV